MMRVNRCAVLLLLLVPVLASAAGTASRKSAKPCTQKHVCRHEIDQLEEIWRGAILKSNTAAMENLLADDYIAILASGTLQTKDQAVAALHDGKIHFTALEFSDRKVRFYGATALVTSRAEMRGTSAEGDVSGSYRYTRVYVRDGHGSWKIVSFEISPIRASGERK